MVNSQNKRYIYENENTKPEKLYLPISLLAFAEAGYKTLHLFFPFFGSSDAKTLPVAEEWKNHEKRNI